jgi:hypothetical protein
LRPGDAGDDSGPPAPQIDVFTGSGLRWDEVKVPPGIEVVDHRLEAHGYELTDGTVLEGSVVDLTSGQPMPATVRLDAMDSTQQENPYTTVDRINAGSDGRWVLKSAPAGRHRVVVQAEGYAPRVIAYEQFDNQPRWISYQTGLAPAVAVTGRVVDAQGEPLAEVDVRLGNVVGPDGKSYGSPEGYKFTTDRDGRFEASPVPQGRASIHVHKPGYSRPGLGLAVDMPASDITLRMVRSGSLEISVNFGSRPRPAGYLIEVEPEGGAAVGRWSASGNLGENGSIRFENVPPGRYVITGRPNPGSEREQTQPLAVQVEGGDAVRVAIRAR